MSLLVNYELIPRFKYIQQFLDSRHYQKIPQILLILLLKGSFNISKYSSSQKIEQNIDYSILGTCKNNSRAIRSFIENVRQNDGKLYFSQNFRFYKLLLLEFISCLIATRNDNGVASLVHIYRILEGISFALPLLYIKKSNDYLHTYAHFKKFFDQSNQDFGELKFLQIALDSILNDQEKRFTFTYELENSEKKALYQCLKDFKNIDKNNLQNDEYIRFDLSINETINFIVRLRNSFFHALSGKHHISLDQLHYPDLTFIKLSTNFINALSYISIKTTEYLYMP